MYHIYTRTWRLLVYITDNMLHNNRNECCFVHFSLSLREAYDIRGRNHPTLNLHKDTLSSENKFVRLFSLPLSHSIPTRKISIEWWCSMRSGKGGIAIRSGVWKWARVLRTAKSSPSEKEDENKLEFGMWYKTNGVLSFIAWHCTWLRLRLDSFLSLCSMETMRIYEWNNEEWIIVKSL